MAADDALALGVVGNCEVAALVDSAGRVVWMCLPRPDGDPVFAALLQRELGAAPEGVFAIELEQPLLAEQRYERNTAVLETVLTDTQGGAIRIVDFCPRFRARGRTFRPMMLMRRVERISGRPLVRIRLRPQAGYGSAPATLRAGSHHLSFTAGETAFRVTTDVSLSALQTGAAFVPDAPLHFIIGPDETISEDLASLVQNFLGKTRQYWQDWVRTLAIPADWQEAVIRAAITLKLCTYEDTGAVLAALTTSLPESADSGRNWDYRYCWLRDAYFVVQALNRLGATRTMEGYLHYIDRIAARSHGALLQPLYRLDGGLQVQEQIITTLPGFRGMGPVRVGNQAAEQLQHDVYGAVILAATQLFIDERLVQPADIALFTQLEKLGERAAAVFGQPDAGPWEFRGSAQVHTYSAAISWAGCDRLARIAAHLGERARARHWQARARQMRQQLLEQAWNPRLGTFAGAWGGDEVDATLLLLPELGLLPATDPRFLATLERIGHELRSGDLLYRYRHVDDFGTPHTTFTVCAFWYVNALAASGQLQVAREQFARLLQHRNALGLLSEDIDPRTGALWGNYPQTYSLVGIITSALRLSRSWEEVT